jgi:mono/diheme cytochrome c family protein
VCNDIDSRTVFGYTLMCCETELSPKTGQAGGGMSQVIREETGMRMSNKENAGTSRRAIIALGFGLSAMVVALMLVAPPSAVAARNSEIERGKYLVGFGGCNDCHTPGYFFGKPDMTRFLGGSEVGFEIPGLGVFHGPNLTPDKETGLGKWSAQEIAAAITKGERPDGRKLAPIMPWHAFASLTRQDVNAIVEFLRSLPAVSNKVPGPFGPSEKQSSFVMKIVAPEPAAKVGSMPK